MMTAFILQIASSLFLFDTTGGRMAWALMMPTTITTCNRCSSQSSQSTQRVLSHGFPSGTPAGTCRKQGSSSSTRLNDYSSQFDFLFQDDDTMTTTTTATTTTTTTTALRSVLNINNIIIADKNDLADFLTFWDPTPWIVVGLALTLGVAAQSFINQMLEGDQGLGAFLKDGSGYNRSGFRSKTSSASSSSSFGSQDDSQTKRDPLPWLKLPQLDFVEVAGQGSSDAPGISPEQEAAFLHQLEFLRTEMTTKLEQGQVEEASRIRRDLESLMEEAGIEWNDE